MTHLENKEREELCALDREGGIEREKNARERERERIEFLQSFITNIIHNTVKLQYSFIKKTKPTHKCIKNKSPSTTAHNASL